MPNATPSPIRLTDNQLTELMRLAAPLAPPCRAVFLRILAHEFRGRADVGDGELFRVARETIQANKLFDAPLETRPPDDRRGRPRKYA
jgi:hypothetical protein